MNWDERLSICMITMNEALAIESVLRAIKDVAPRAEIVIVDSSVDETPKVAEKWGARVIRQFPPCGYGPAMERVLREANREVVVTLDCDNTYPIEVIPDLLRDILHEGYDLVDAARLEKKPRAMPWLNYLANVFFAKIASILFLKRFNDLHSGMRAYRKSMLDNLSFYAKGDALPVELLIKPILAGYRWKIRYIPYHQRLGQSTLRPFNSAWWTFKRLWFLRMS